MADEIQTAFSLLLIGMLTVFAVLAIIVGVGKVLILSLNRLAGDTGVSGKRQPFVARKSSHDLHTKKVAAIAAAVELLTNGEGRIRNIERM